MAQRITLLLGVLLLPVGARAASVFLNGVNIDGAVNQKFDSCSVVIDQSGNVFITAKGYAVADPNAPVAQPGAVPPATPPPAPAQHVWLVTEKAQPGMSQYDLDLFVNAKFVRRFLDSEEHVVLEITKYLSPGNNKLNIVARKNLAGGQRSTSPSHYFRMVIGEGEAQGRNVMINKKLVDYKRSAADTQDFNDEFVIKAN
jgi:hypothetical protein